MSKKPYERILESLGWKLSIGTPGFWLDPASSNVVSVTVTQRGLEAFYDESNLQGLCKRCHDLKTARGE
jgi:5-methylcytosine-specific restriction endonuclease McrA